METTILYWGYIGIMENKMETTVRVLGLNMDRALHKSILVVGFYAVAAYAAFPPRDPGRFGLPSRHKMP